VTEIVEAKPLEWVLHAAYLRPAWTVAGEHIDAGVSGARDSRPELNRLIADAHKRRFDVVCVWRFDRFARSVSRLLRALETFKALGIDFVSFSEQMDTSTPAGKMVFTVLGAVAELERSLTVERVRAGQRNARAKGKRLGRPGVAVDAAKIGSLRASGASWQTANDHPPAWYQRGYGQASLLQPVQKPLTSRVRKSLILRACSRLFLPDHKQMFYKRAKYKLTTHMSVFCGDVRD
jgi:resolvase-like protein